MRKRVLFSAMMMVAALCTTSCVIQKNNYSNVKQTEETQVQEEDEIHMVSLIMCPEISIARLTVDIKTIKNKEQIENIAQGLIFGDQTMEPIEGGYEVVWQGYYDKSADEVEEAGKFQYGSEPIPKSQINKENMEITVIGAKHFEASDGGNLVFPVDISTMGLCICPREDWQSDQRRVYVVADFKDGSSKLITRLPVKIYMGKKEKNLQPPREIEELENQEDGYLAPITGGIEVEHDGIRFATSDDIDVDSIENVRLVVQELE